MDHLAKVIDHRVILEKMAHHQDALSLVSQLDQVLGVVYLEDERFLNIDVLAALQRTFT
jgi:hypothetical protein